MMVQSTIDKIKDTTIFRMVRKLCGVIDEQNTVVENIQTELDNFDLDGVKTDVTNLKTNDAKQDAKISAISDNVTNLDEEMETANDEITYLKSDVSTLNASMSNAQTDILNLRDEDKKLTNALPKTYTLYRNGKGKIQAQVETIDGTLFNSNVLDMIIPYQYDIISGTTERSFKLDITMSDGSKYTTNDFIIPAGGGTEVVVTGITLAKDTSNVNRFHVGINLSDGTMIDSGYISMVDNVVATYADSKLTISVNGVSSVPVAIDVSGEVTAGNGITITSGTIAIDDTVVALKSDIADMMTKTNADATYATKTALALTDSVANEANNKANRAIDNVSISGSTMTFTKINDEHIDVNLPSSQIYPLFLAWVGGTSSSSVATLTNGFWVDGYGSTVGNIFLNIVATPSATGTTNIFFAKAAYRFGPTISNANIFTFNTTDVDAVLRDYLISMKLPNGKYKIQMVFLGGAFDSFKSPSHLDYEMNDGNLTLISTSSSFNIVGRAGFSSDGKYLLTIRDIWYYDNS